MQGLVAEVFRHRCKEFRCLDTVLLIMGSFAAAVAVFPMRLKSRRCLPFCNLSTYPELRNKKIPQFMLFILAVLAVLHIMSMWPMCHWSYNNVFSIFFLVPSICTVHALSLFSSGMPWHSSLYCNELNGRNEWIEQRSQRNKVAYMGTVPNYKQTVLVYVAFFFSASFVALFRYDVYQFTQLQTLLNFDDLLPV